jgi:hypothetical protein
VPFALDQFTAVLGTRGPDGRPYLLIGGQAVYYWASRYMVDEPSLEQWKPFTSKDIDFQGGLQDLRWLAKELGTQAQMPDRREMTAFAGAVQLKLGGESTSVEFVRFIPGVKPSDVVKLAIEHLYQGRLVRVLDPISLLCCKAYLALKVDQKERRDADHARIMVLCVRAFLRETLRGVESGELPPRGWLGAIERVLKLAESSIGRNAVRHLGLDWTQALPEVEIAASTHAAAVQLRKKRLPQWRSKVKPLPPGSLH